MRYCKHFRKNDTGNGRCLLIEGNAEEYYLLIRQVFNNMYNNRHFVLNNECFWEAEDMCKCPFYEPNN